MDYQGKCFGFLIFGRVFAESLSEEGPYILDPADSVVGYDIDIGLNSSGLLGYPSDASPCYLVDGPCRADKVIRVVWDLF